MLKEPNITIKDNYNTLEVYRELLEVLEKHNVQIYEAVGLLELVKEEVIKQIRNP